MNLDLTTPYKAIANKQFEIGGFSITFDDIPEDEMVKVGKKMLPWYDVYKLTEEQEVLWRSYIKSKTGGSYYDNSEVAYMELRYGLVRKIEIKEKGETSE